MSTCPETRLEQLRRPRRLVSVSAEQPLPTDGVLCRRATELPRRPAAASHLPSGGHSSRSDCPESSLGGSGASAEQTISAARQRGQAAGRLINRDLLHPVTDTRPTAFSEQDLKGAALSQMSSHFDSDFDISAFNHLITSD